MVNGALVKDWPCVGRMIQFLEFHFLLLTVFLEVSELCVWFFGHLDSTSVVLHF